MIRVLLYLGLLAAAATLADLLGRRLARRGECGLHRALILPDTCQGDCPSGQSCRAAETRPHWLFGTQAAACVCIDSKLNDMFPESGSSAPTEPPAQRPEREQEDA